MRRASAAIAAFVLAACVVCGQDPRLSFLKGNEAMNRQQFDEAAAAYEAVLASGVESAEVHFNLANACFRAGRLGPAIQHYRIARALLPRDPDVAWNLEIARGAVKDQVSRPEPSEIVKTLLWFHLSTSEREARAAAIALFLIGMALLHARLFVRRPALTRIALAVLVLAALAGASLLMRAGRAPEAVVLPAELVVRSGPGAGYAEHMRLHEGVEARIDEDRGEWVKLDVDGKKGWAPAALVGRL
jgi:tetratricopeptide (TPR) repeat protein